MSERQMPLERAITDWMYDKAAGAPIALLEQILETTAASSPQPAWRAMAAERTLRLPTNGAAVGLANRNLVLAAVIGLVLAATALAVGAYLLLNPKPPEGGDWPGFRGDAARAGVDLHGPTGNPFVAWRFPAGGAVMEVAVVGDRAYFASDDGRLHAAALEGGIEEWAVDVAAPPLSGPFFADGRLYLSDSTGAFHAYDAADGSSTWTSKASYEAPSRAIAAASSLYFGTGDGLVVA